MPVARPIRSIRTSRGLCAKRGYKMATIAVAHRLARITFAMLRDGTDFDVAPARLEEGPFEAHHLRRYRLKQARALAR